MIINQVKRNLRNCLAAVSVLVLSNNTSAATFVENFDSPSVASTNNNGAKITYPSGDWFTFGITKPTTPNEGDRINGLYSMRMRGLANKNTLTMQFDLQGAGVLSFNYASYSNHSGGKFKVQKSVNAGTSWTDLGEETTVPAWSGTFLTFSTPVNESGNVRFRIVVTETTNANTQVNIDDFMITGFNTIQTALPQISVPTGIYETEQTVSISCETPGATIHFTTDGTPATVASPVFASAFKVNNTTKIRAIALAAGNENSREEVTLLSFPESIETLAAFYTKMATTGTNPIYFKYTGEAIVTYSYLTTTSGKYVYIQDASAGMLLNDYYKKLAINVESGDKITGITGQVNSVNSTPQIYPWTDVTVTASGQSVQPRVITLAQVPDYLYQLVQINDLNFEEANGTKTFTPNTPYLLNETGAATSAVKFRTPANMATNFDYINTVIPAKVNMVALIARNSSVSTDYMVFSRSASELNVTLSGLTPTRIDGIRISGNMLVIDPAVRGTVELFTTSGQLHSRLTVGATELHHALTSGIYIIRHNGNATKVIIR